MIFSSDYLIHNFMHPIQCKEVLGVCQCVLSVSVSDSDFLSLELHHSRSRYLLASRFLHFPMRTITFLVSAGSVGIATDRRALSFFSFAFFFLFCGAFGLRLSTLVSGWYPSFPVSAFIPLLLGS